MRALTVQEVAEVMGGRILGDVSVPAVSSVSTDSRTVAPGALFFALAGERFDGHDFVGQALERGAAAVVVSNVSRAAAEYRDCGRLIHVQDTLSSLGVLASWYRLQAAATVIGVAGSNGKTSTKELIAAVLGTKKRGRAAPASYNNSVGVPLTLLSVEPADEFVVVEIGTNHPGEVAALGRIAQPDIAVIASIGEEHLEFLGDVGSVAREEFSLLQRMRDRAFVAISDQAAAFAPSGMTKDRTVVIYGISGHADLRASDITCEGLGQRFKVNARFEYRLPLLGRHNVVNALGAIAVGTRMRMTHEEIAAALLQVRPAPMRMERMTVGDVTVINDAYNANPSSMRAALEVMDNLPEGGRKVLVLGDMKELGQHTERCHLAVGQDAGRSTARVIIAAGTNARVLADGATATAGTTKRIHWFPSVEMLAERIGDLIEPGDIVLLKGSRAVRMERLVEVLASRRASASGRQARRPKAGAGR